MRGPLYGDGTGYDSVVVRYRFAPRFRRDPSCGCRSKRTIQRSSGRGAEPHFVLLELYDDDDDDDEGD